MIRTLVAAAILCGSIAHADPAPAPLTPEQRAAAFAALVARTDSVAKEVSKVRGLRLKKPIPHEVVGTATIRERLLKQAAEPKQAASTVAEGLALERWGMIPAGTDFAALYIELYSEQIAGYYDTDAKRLTISDGAGDDPAWLEMVLAHELDHGLQDQAFDLKKFEDLPDTEGDAAAARRALVEGDGIGTMIDVVLARTHASVDWTDPAVTKMIGDAMGIPSASGNDAMDKAPLAIRESMLFPYRAGFAFVAALRHHKPWSAVDAAFARPPASTEQVMHPELYFANEAPVPIAASVPPSLAVAGYTVGDSSVWGELGWQLWLRSHALDTKVATDAAAGWGGDRVLTLVKPGAKSVGVSRSEWDSMADAIEAAEAATKALDDSLVGAKFERTDTAARWLALDGTVGWVERRGSSLVVAIGVPASLAGAIAAEAWTATSIAKKKR